MKCVCLDPKLLRINCRRPETILVESKRISTDFVLSLSLFLFFSSPRAFFLLKNLINYFIIGGFIVVLYVGNFIVFVLALSRHRNM